MSTASLEFKIRFTNNAKFSDVFKQRVLHVLKYYPMLHTREIVIGRCRRANYLGSAYEWTVPQRLYLKPNVSQMVIAHELTHLIQGSRQGFGIPHGEKACDIWTMVRMPEQEIDDVPGYIIPSRLQSWFRNDWHHHRKYVKEACSDALVYRNQMKYRHYIRHFERWIIEYSKQRLHRS